MLGNISLSPIDRHNWKECISLSVLPEQSHLVGANVKSLAEASVRPEATTLGVFDSGTMVGFMMFLKSPEDSHYYIHRLMIDGRFQRSNVGTEAMRQTIAQIKNLTDVTDRINVLFLTYNHRAEAFYKKTGFIDTGQVIEDEKLFSMKL